MSVLYPTPPNDQNISCADCFYSPSCPYSCYDDLYPIPPPMLPESASPSKGGQPISTPLIIVITVLGACFLLVSYYVIIVKFYKRWNPFGPRRGQLPEATDEDFLDENRGPEIDHPIWYINTIGLQPSIISAITTFRYKRGDNWIEGTECAVCLNEFQNDETLRLLPKCNHAFHIPCIDTWLRSHTNCPVCRAGIVSNSVANHPVPVAPNVANSIIIPVNETFQGENSETGESNNTDETSDDGLCANRSDTTDESEVWVVDNHDHEAADSAGNNDDMNEDEKHEIRSVKRSVSVDSFMAADISRDVSGLSMIDSDEVYPSSKVKAQQSSGEEKTNGSSSITEHLRKKPVRMKRSFTYGGRSFLSRQYPRSNSVLPM